MGNRKVISARQVVIKRIATHPEDFVDVAFGNGTDYLTDPANNVSDWNLALMDGSITPIELELSIEKIRLLTGNDQVEQFLVRTIIFWITDAWTVFYPSGFGYSSSPLTNGIEFLSCHNHRGEWVATNTIPWLARGTSYDGAIKRNYHLRYFTADKAPPYYNEGYGTMGTAWHVKENMVADAWLINDRHKLKFVINDNLTANFTSDAMFIIRAQGQIGKNDGTNAYITEG